MKIPRDLKPGDVITNHAEGTPLTRSIKECERLKERAEKAEALAAMRLAGYNNLEASYSTSVAGHKQQLDAARAESEQWKERAENAETNRHHHNECLFCSTRFSAVYDRCPVCAARAEAEAAKQEAAGLRARKVKLPGAQREDGILPTITARAEAWNACLGKCADAIRAAGIEVEG